MLKVNSLSAKKEKEYRKKQKTKKQKTHLKGKNKGLKEKSFDKTNIQCLKTVTNFPKLNES